MSSIPTGKHILTGVCEISVPCGYDGENMAEGILLTIDGKNYLAYTDPDDGYRSYGCFFQTDEYDQKNPFPYQDVIVENRQWDEEDEDGYYQKGDEVVIYNAEDHSEIFRCGTDRRDDYYPCGYWHYYPQNLPINKQKKQEEDAKKFDDALNTMYEVFGLEKPECRIPTEKNPEITEYEQLKPGSDSDVDALIATMDLDKWVRFEAKTRDALKIKFQEAFKQFMGDQFWRKNTIDLLSLYDAFKEVLGL